MGGPLGGADVDGLGGWKALPWEDGAGGKMLLPPWTDVGGDGMEGKEVPLLVGFAGPPGRPAEAGGMVAKLDELPSRGIWAKFEELPFRNNENWPSIASICGVETGDGW